MYRKKDKFILKEWYIVLIYIFFLSFIIYSCLKFINNDKKVIDLREERIAYCTSDEVNEEDVSWCETFLSSKNDYQLDFYTMMSDILLFKLHFMNFVGFFIIAIPTINKLYSYFQNNVLNNYLCRESYNSFIIKFIKKSYSYSWILPSLAGVLIIICSLYTTFDPTYAVYSNSSIWTSNIIYKPILFVFLYLFNIFIYSLSYANLCLIVLRKNHNLVKSIILSILLFVGLELFFELFVNLLLFNRVLHSEIGNLFNIMNIFTFNDVFGISKLMIFSILFYLLTFGIVIFVYKDKENLIIDCEKNN